MDHPNGTDTTLPNVYSLETLEKLVDEFVGTHVPIHAYANHWVVRRDELPSGADDALLDAALSLKVAAEEPDTTFVGDEVEAPARSLDQYSLEPCADKPAVCWRLDHLTLRVHRAH